MNKKTVNSKEITFIENDLLIGPPPGFCPSTIIVDTLKFVYCKGKVI